MFIMTYVVALCDSGQRIKRKGSILLLIGAFKHRKSVRKSHSTCSTAQPRSGSTVQLRRGSTSSVDIFTLNIIPKLCRNTIDATVINKANQVQCRLPNANVNCHRCRRNRWARRDNRRPIAAANIRNFKSKTKQPRLVAVHKFRVCLRRTGSGY